MWLLKTDYLLPLLICREAQLFVGWVSGSVTLAGVGFHASILNGYIAFLIHKRYIPDPEQFNQQRFKCAAQMREPL
ncbi:MAG: hypothetical protein GPJ08_14225 [Microcystis aeruginosa G13-09]|nr:hypothetical protein [Microcystis aeruginosa G13-09]